MLIIEVNYYITYPQKSATFESAENLTVGYNRAWNKREMHHRRDTCTEVRCIYHPVNVSAVLWRMFNTAKEYHSVLWGIPYSNLIISIMEEYNQFL